MWRYRHLLIMSFGPPFVTVYFSYRGVPRLFPFVSLTGAYWREIQYRRPFKKRPLSVNFLILTKAFLGFFRLWILVEHIEGWYNIGALAPIVTVNFRILKEAFITMLFPFVSLSDWSTWREGTISAPLGTHEKRWRCEMLAVPEGILRNIWNLITLRCNLVVSCVPEIFSRVWRWLRCWMLNKKIIECSTKFS